jgi:glutathione S-transferase
MKPTLVIGNKNYSSWSMRPWVLMHHFGIEFEELRIPLGQPDTRERLMAVSPTGRVPCLIVNDEPVWDSLAIAEWLHETHPALGLYPADARARTLARCASAEMHSGFPVLRRTLPMNIRRDRARDTLVEGLDEEIARIEEIFAQGLHAYEGPYLFGGFSVADAMFAPVVMRLHSYRVLVSAAARRYMDAMLANRAVAAWMEQARAEPEAMAAIDTLD